MNFVIYNTLDTQYPYFGYKTYSNKGDFYSDHPNLEKVYIKVNLKTARFLLKNIDQYINHLSYIHEIDKDKLKISLIKE